MAWPGGHRAALSLSFDDARASQLHCGMPTLQRLGVPATFFVLPEAVASDPLGWRRLLACGHEIGNHTLTHPCSANHVWSRHNALEQMTVRDYAHELSEANRRLRLLLGVEPAVFAYPCGETFVGRGLETTSVVPLVARRFAVGRTFNDCTANSPTELDFAQVRCVNSDARTFGDLRPMLEATLDDGAWLVLGGHEISDSGVERESTRARTIERVIGWCREHGFLIDTLGAAARVIEEMRSLAVSRATASSTASRLLQPQRSAAGPISYRSAPPTDACPSRRRQ